MATTPQFVSVPNTIGANYANADGTTAKTVFTAASGGSRIDAIVVSTNDTAANKLVVGLVKSATTYYLGTYSFSASGDGTAYVATDILTLIPGLGALGLVLKTGDTLTIAMVNSVTAVKTTSVVVLGGDF
jgi:hypothetical protein